MLQKILNDGVSSGVAPGGVLIVGNSATQLAAIAFGVTQTHPPEPAVPVTLDTLYDIASLTKPIATVGTLMKLIEQRRLSLDTAVPSLASPHREPITVRHLVGHASGLPAHIEMFRRIWEGQRMGKPTAREAIVEMARQAEPVQPPGASVIYSDLGFILLGDLLEQVTGERLDALAARLVTEPLGMSSTRFVDLDSSVRLDGTVAPTEQCPRRGLVCGEVHDENAHSAGGICGHAGLFSTAPDLARFARAMLAAARGQPSHFDPAIVQTFLSTSAAPSTSWRLGWDTPSDPAESNAGSLWPRTGVGHLGFTGCSMWLDPDGGRFAILITNRVHPTRHTLGIKPFRRAVMDAVVKELF